MKLLELIGKLLTKSAGIKLPKDMKITDEDRKKFKKDNSKTDEIVNTSWMI